jgi:hypothetical protein
MHPPDGCTSSALSTKTTNCHAVKSLSGNLNPAGRLLEPTALPNVARSDPNPAEDYDALLRATRWSAATPFVDPDGSGPLDRLPLFSPFHGAMQVDDFQLVPLLKALRMPHVNLLLADDVGPWQNN